MKIIRLLTLFYDAVLLVVLVSMGLIIGSPRYFGPSLFLLPVAIHYLLAFADELTGIFKFITKPIVLQVLRVLATYSYLVIVLVVVANLAASSSFLQALLNIIFLPLFLPLFFVFFDRKQFLQFRIKKITNFSKLLFRRFEKTQQTDPTNKVDPTSKTNSTSKTDQQKILSPSSGTSQDSKPAASQIVSGADNEEVVEGGEVAASDQPMVDYELAGQEDQLTELTTRSDSVVFDAQKRQFLKIVGGGGTSLLLMLFFMPKQASAAFFGSTPGPGIVGIKDSDGNKIDPAEKQPVDGYSITEIDDSDADSYYGFINQDGAWYIAREDSLGSYRYAAGSSGFSTNWGNRKTSLSYGYFDDVF